MGYNEILKQSRLYVYAARAGFSVKMFYNISLKTVYTVYYTDINHVWIGRYNTHVLNIPGRCKSPEAVAAYVKSALK